MINQKPIDQKSPDALLTDEFLERILEDVPRAIPSNIDRFTYDLWFRRLLREKLLERLS